MDGPLLFIRKPIHSGYMIDSRTSLLGTIMASATAPVTTIGSCYSIMPIPKLQRELPVIVQIILKAVKTGR